MGREGSRGVLLSPLGRRGLLLLLPGLEARGRGLAGGRGLGGGRGVVLELLRLLLLWLWLWRARLWCSGLGVVAC